MASEPKPFLSPAAYLALERKAEFRSEYLNGQTHATAGASTSHGRVVTNLVMALGTGLRSRNCNTYSTDLRLHIPATGLFTYPDVMVTCGEEIYLDEQADTLTNPHLLIEVLSPSTQDYDRGRKFEQYRSIPSLYRYVTVSQDQILLEMWIRQDKGWLFGEYRDPLAAVELISPDIAVSLAAIYEKVAWPGTGAEPHDA